MEHFNCVYEHEQYLYWEVGLYIFVVRMASCCRNM